MATPTEKRRLLLAGVVSTGLVTAVSSFAEFSLPNIDSFDPIWVAALIMSHLVVVSGRGLLMRSFAPTHAHSNVASWIRLAARHQLIFSVFPSGLGDLSFPLLAKQIVSVQTVHALRIMILVRVRDTIVLGCIAICGGALQILHWEAAALIAATGALALWFVDDLPSIVAQIAVRLPRNERMREWIAIFADGKPATAGQRARSAVLSVLIWCASIGAVLAVFRAIGEPLSPSGAMIFIAMINAAGVFAISIAGLGVSEAGAAGALLLVGRSVQVAAAIALIVRPALLISMLASCLCLDLFLRSFRSGSAS